VLVPLVCGAVVTLGCGGATLGKRFVSAAVCGVAVAVFYTVLSAMLGHSGGITAAKMVASCMWRIFVFSLFSLMGVIITELMLGDPELK